MAHRRATQTGKLTSFMSPYHASNVRQLSGSLFWQLDVVGLILLSAVLCLILIPLTIAGGFGARWGHADVITMLVIGFVLIPVFAIWEIRFARHPAVPFHLLWDRSVIGGLFVAMFLNFIWIMQGECVAVSRDRILLIRADFNDAGTSTQS